MKKNISIPIPNIFSFEETLSFLDRGYDECLYHLTKKSVSKLVSLSDEKGLITIFQKEKKLHVELSKDKISKNNLQEVKAFVEEWFDLNRDLEPFYFLLKKHKFLSDLPKKYFGSRLIGIPNLFETICWAIIGQQINLTFAYQLKRRLVEKYGTQKTINNQIFLSFPTPQILAKATRSDLADLKFSRQKIDYLLIISHAFTNNEMSTSILSTCKNKEEQIEKLTAIKGIGIWSANYILMKNRHEMSCITYGDSGLNQALHRIFDTPKKPTKDEVNLIFKKFKGWESYLNFYLWKTLNS